MIELFNLSTEVMAVAMIVAGLGTQLDNSQADTLSPESMKNALYGVQIYLERIATDMASIDSKIAVKGGAI